MGEVNAVTPYVMRVAVVLDCLYQPLQSELAVKHVGYRLIFPLLQKIPDNWGGAQPLNNFTRYL